MTKLKNIRLTAFISAVVIFLMLLFSASVSAVNRTVSLTLICRKENTILTGMKWRLYNVGQRVGDHYVLNDSFKDYPVEIDITSDDTLNNAATTLENYAVIDQIPYQNSGEIDETGCLVFPDLPSGLYMVSGTVFNIDEVFYYPAASLIEIDTNSDKDNLEHIVYPKVKYALLSEINLNNTVKKIWNDNKTEHEAVNISIFKNTDLYKTVTLNDDNDWTFNWKTTEVAEWRIKEAVVPKDYTVSYQSDNGKFAVENTFTGTEIISPSSVVTTVYSKPKLPQTGQLWWPVAVSGGGGIIMLIIGIRLRFKKSGVNYEK